MRRLSIGLRLTLWYLAIFAFAQLVFGAGMWFILRHNLYDLVDDGLESQLDDLRTFLQAQKKDASLAKVREEVNETYAIQHTGDYLEIYAEGGELIYRSGFLQAHAVGHSFPQIKSKNSIFARTPSVSKAGRSVLPLRSSTSTAAFTPWKWVPQPATRWKLSICSVPIY